MNEYLNWTEVQGELKEGNDTYLILSSLPEKLKARLQDEKTTVIINDTGSYNAFSY